MSEEYYDKIIAPALKDVAKMCKKNGMPFLAAVQYNDESWAQTITGVDGLILPMYMIAAMIHTAPNIDAFIIHLLKHCRKNGINLDQSLFLSKYAGEVE